MSDLTVDISLSHKELEILDDLLKWSGIYWTNYFIERRDELKVLEHKIISHKVQLKRQVRRASQH